jgi:PAS domain S-box-containing protein
VSDAPRWPADGGEMGELIRARDWSATPLGPAEGWPPALRAAVRLCLDSGFAMCVYAGPASVLIYNHGFVAALGANKHPWALGRPAREVWAEVWEQVGPELARVMGGGAPVRHVNERFVIDRGGHAEETFWTYAFSPVRDEDGSVVAVHSVVTETTAHVSAEQALRESEAQYHALFDSMDEAYAVVEVMADTEGRWNDFMFLEVNPAFMQHTGMPYPVGLTATQILGTPNPRWAEIYGRVAETGEPVRVEEPEPTLGRVFDLNVFRLGGPGSRRIAVLFTDVTARKAAGQALRESEERHRIIVEGARDYAILTMDPEGRIESWSPGAETVYGWCAAETVGRLVDMTFTPEDRAAGEALKERAQAAATGLAPDVRWHLRSDGTRVFIDGVTRALRHPGGELRGFLKIGQDVTRRRNTEEALRELRESLERRVAERTAELESEMAERERAQAARAEVLRQLVSVEENERLRISRELHDSLGQLVTGVRLGLKSLERGRGDDDALTRLERLTDRVAEEMQDRVLELRPPALDSLGVAVALQSQLQEWSDRSGIACDFHAAGLDHARLPPEVEITVYRVVQEGLTNVLKHSGARHVGLVLERRRGMVSAILEDDGRGFDPDAALAAPEKARRLGLRGMRERIALLGGEMEIESAPGSGTTLFVRIPDPAQPPPKEDGDGQGPGEGGAPAPTAAS